VSKCPWIVAAEKEGDLMTTRRLWFKFGFWLVLFLLLTVEYLLAGTTFRDARRMSRFQNKIPLITEFFEEHKEDLDTLRYGEFSRNDAEVRVVHWDYNYSFLQIEYTYEENRAVITESNWYTLEWLSDEEKEAIHSIMDNLSTFNFERGRGPYINAEAIVFHRAIGSPNSSNGVFILYPGIEPPVFLGGTGVQVFHDDIMVDLGQGYRIFIYATREEGFGMGSQLAEILDRILFIIMILIFVRICVLAARLYNLSEANKLSETNKPWPNIDISDSQPEKDDNNSNGDPNTPHG